MGKVITYFLLYLVLLLFQTLLFDNIQVTTLIQISLYVAFIILLPINLAGAWLLLLGFGVGASADLLMGTPGINTVATVFVAFCRPGVLLFFLGKDEVHEGGVPDVDRLGQSRFFKYAFVLVLLHNAAFFYLERLTFQGFGFLLARILLSSVFTTAMVYFVQLGFERVKSKI